MKQNNLMDMLDDPQLRVPDAYMREDCNLYEQRHACVYSAAPNAQCGDIAYMWDNTPVTTRINGSSSNASGTLRNAGGTKLAEKLYATGNYAPLPCKCPAIKLKELGSRSTGGCTLSGHDKTGSEESHHGGEHAGAATGGGSVGTANPRVTYYEYDAFDPDVIRANTINSKMSRGIPSADVTGGMAQSLCRSHDSGVVMNNTEPIDCSTAN